uniref:Uncharacterized protein n=1 Tax=Pleurosigma intermedium TaxID=197753 RepID=A0A8F9W5S6_9STRA|nr:hypothetical protein [Pleurosigma sp. mgcode 4]
MTIETIIWIISIGFITYKYDIILLNSNDKMSDNYHFIVFSYLIMHCFHTLYKTFFNEKTKELNESFIWIIFITIMSVSCRNNLGEDLDTFHFLFFSLIVLYLLYIYRSIYPKEETLIIPKILIVILIVFKIFWPTITYLWPYGADYPDNFDWTDWPDINF